MHMEDETKKSVGDSLREWGFDVDKFQTRAKESLDAARGDLTEVTGTLRQTLVEAKDVLIALQRGGSPAAAELRAGFERAWQEIDRAFKSARQKAKEAETPVETPSSSESDEQPPSPS